MTLNIPKENIVPLFDSRFIKVFDLQYEEGQHYYDASRRSLENLAATKSEEEFQAMLPDGVTCVVILKGEDSVPRLLLTREYRYPTGHFLLSPPAGLLDPEDASLESPKLPGAAPSPDALREAAVLTAARREIKEETGLSLTGRDSLYLFNPLLFSSPGMTDESNALVCAVIDLTDPSQLSQKGAVGSERFDGFVLLTKEEAENLLTTGRDAEGVFYSVYTWVAMMYFVSGLWESHTRTQTREAD